MPLTDEQFNSLNNSERLGVLAAFQLKEAKTTKKNLDIVYDTLVDSVSKYGSTIFERWKSFFPNTYLVMNSFYREKLNAIDRRTI